MKRVGLLVTLVLLAAALVACGRSAAAEPGGSTATASGAGLSENYTDALPVASQLIVGSLRLEDSDLAIDAGQAGDLLPLWQAYQSLSSSDTTAEAEIQGLVNQIQETMSSGQVAAIAGMQLTAEDATAAMQEQGAAFGRGGQDSSQNSSSGGFGGFRGGGFPAPPEGGFPGGGFRDGGGGGFRSGGFAGGGAPGGFENMTPEERATAVAERFGNLSTNDLATRGLLNALITSLRLKTGEIDQADIAAQQALRGVLRWLPMVSETTGLPIETLRDGVSGGTTLAEVIEAQGSDVAAVEAALREALAANTDLDENAIDEQVAQVLHGTSTTD